jgi:hypothetical protein
MEWFYFYLVSILASCAILMHRHHTGGVRLSRNALLVVIHSSFEVLNVTVVTHP